MKHIKIKYEDITQDLKLRIINEINSINDNQTPEALYNNIVNSVGSVDSLSKIFNVQFDLVMELRQVNDLV